MPSLKDLKNRIASVKNDAEDHQGDADGRGGKASPRTGSRGGRAPLCRPHDCRHGRAAASAAGSDNAPRLLAGTGERQAVQLLVVMTSERGLCGGFNSTIVKSGAGRRTQLLAQGKTVKILTVGKKGREQLKRDMADLSSVTSI
jgi:F-type H+-transporting ATPase subunit gamma